MCVCERESERERERFLVCVRDVMFLFQFYDKFVQKDDNSFNVRMKFLNMCSKIRNMFQSIFEIFIHPLKQIRCKF